MNTTESLRLEPSRKGASLELLVPLQVTAELSKPTAEKARNKFAELCLERWHSLVVRITNGRALPSKNILVFPRGSNRSRVPASFDWHVNPFWIELSKHGKLTLGGHDGILLLDRNLRELGEGVVLRAQFQKAWVVFRSQRCDSGVLIHQSTRPCMPRELPLFRHRTRNGSLMNNFLDFGRTMGFTEP